MATSKRYRTVTPEDYGLPTYRPLYTYVIDLNERGRFLAHVDNDRERTVFTLSNEDGQESCGGALWMIEDGFMRHIHDVEGLEQYLKSIGIMPAHGRLEEEA